MSTPKEQLRFAAATDEEQETAVERRELYLRDGRTLVISEQGGEQLVEVRSESGQLEVRIQLTEEGPVLRMDAVRMQLKATESVSIEAKQLTLTGTETVAVEAGQLTLHSTQDTVITADGEVRVVGTMIYLN